MVAIDRSLVGSELAAAGATNADAIPAAARRAGASPGQVLALTVIGTLVLGLFASRDLPSWTERLEDVPFAPTIRVAAAQWDAAMERIGFTRPHEAIREEIRALLDRGWGAAE
ncbi:MAG: hypothetical protein JO267_14785 [Alphaproteobacteria bacterium]|nr:hypothetical protein [Alphaproteobacteria bacterium]